MNYEKVHQPLLSRKFFLLRLMRNLVVGAIIIIFSLTIGIVGYRYFEHMHWIDAFMNAAMILSGMGPAANVVTEGGKIFAGLYALFSGVIFLIVIAIIFAPVLHRFLHQFHLTEDKQNLSK